MLTLGSHGPLGGGALPEEDPHWGRALGIYGLLVLLPYIPESAFNRLRPSGTVNQPLLL